MASLTWSSSKGTTQLDMFTLPSLQGKIQASKDTDP